MEIKTPNNAAGLAPTAANAIQKKKGEMSAMDYFQSESFKKQIQMALPKFFDADRFVRGAISDFRLNPALRECSVPSVLGFYMQAAMCGLEPSSVLGQCYPVPFYNNKTGKRECQFIMGYRGMASIARRSGEVQSISAEIVYEKDEFKLVYGLEQDIRHVPYIDGDAGAVRGAYCIVSFKDGSKQFLFMPKDKIDKHRKRSKTGASAASPWSSDYEEMAKKTVFRSLFKWLPISMDIVNPAAVDGTVANVNTAMMENVESATPDDMIEIEFVAAEPEAEAEA